MRSNFHTKNTADESMAHPLQRTSEGSGENEDVTDYVELLRTRLKEKKLLYIADAIIEFDNELTLQDLLGWKKDDLVEIVDDLNEQLSQDGKDKINVRHKNKFATNVVDIATQQKQALLQEKVAAAATPGSSQVKLLFLGKEEEEAIEAIQTGQKFMDQTLVKMKEFLNNLNENTKNVKDDLQKLCDSLKKQIDIKHKQINDKIDFIHKYHLNKLNQQNDLKQESAKVVSKVKLIDI